MTTGASRIPTVSETIRTYAGQSDLRAPSKRRGLIVGVTLLAAVVLFFPSIERVDESNILLFLIILLGPAWEAAYREYRFGGPPRLVVAAALTSLVVSVATTVIFLTVWRVVDGPLALSNPFRWLVGGFFALPMEVQIISLIGLMVLLVVVYFVRRPARQRATDAFEAAVRAERTRRGLPAAS